MAIRKSTAAAQSVRLARRAVLMVSAGARGLFLRRRLATNSHSHSRRITGGLRRQGVTVRSRSAGVAMPISSRRSKGWVLGVTFLAHMAASELRKLLIENQP